MATLPPPHRERVVRLVVASTAFLAGASVLIVIVVRGYLRPAYEAWRYADAQQRSLLSASSSLLLAVLLVVLLLLLVAVFGVRRFFQLPRTDSGRHSTQYVDAWAESARRVQIDPDIDPREKDAS